jgi:hypothetical protein
VNKTNNWNEILLVHTALEDETVFRIVDTQNSDAGQSPEIKNTPFTTQRNFEIEEVNLRERDHLGDPGIDGRII